MDLTVIVASVVVFLVITFFRTSPVSLKFVSEKQLTNIGLPPANNVMSG